MQPLRVVPRFVCHGLTSGASYVFRVKAVNAAGYSPSSPDSEAVVVKAAICKRLRVSIAVIRLASNHSVHPRMESRPSVLSFPSFPSSTLSLGHSVISLRPNSSSLMNLLVSHRLLRPPQLASSSPFSFLMLTSLHVCGGYNHH